MLDEKFTRAFHKKTCEKASLQLLTDVTKQTDQVFMTSMPTSSLKNEIHNFETFNLDG